MKSTLTRMKRLETGPRPTYTPKDFKKAIANITFIPNFVDEKRDYYGLFPEKLQYGNGLRGKIQIQFRFREFPSLKPATCFAVVRYVDWSQSVQKCIPIHRFEGFM